MRPRDILFVQAQTDPLRAPLAVVTIWTAAGARIFCSGSMTDAEISAVGGVIADGSTLADGSLLAGGQLFPVIAIEARVISYGVARDTGSILPTISLRGRRTREPGNMQIALRNDDDYFGRLLAQETLLSAKMDLTIGYRGLLRSKFLTRFQGVIQENILTREQLMLRGETA